MNIGEGEGTEKYLSQKTDRKQPRENSNTQNLVFLLLEWGFTSGQSVWYLNITKFSRSFTFIYITEAQDLSKTWKSINFLFALQNWHKIG